MLNLLLKIKLALIFLFVGYGYITPQTPAGQMLCIFISFIGIPMTLLALKSAGELIAKLVNIIVTLIDKKIRKRAEPKQVEIKSAVILFSIMVVSLLVLTCLSKIYWDLTLVKGLYFWFITLTTVGFGDIAPFRHRIVRSSIKFINTSENRLNQKGLANEKESTALFFLDIAFFLECMIGLCLVSSVLNSIVAALDLDAGKCRLRCPGCGPRKRQNNLENEQHNTPQQEEAEVTCLNMENVGFQKENMGSVSANEIN